MGQQGGARRGALLQRGSANVSHLVTARGVNPESIDLLLKLYHHHHNRYQCSLKKFTSRIYLVWVHAAGRRRLIGRVLSPAVAAARTWEAAGRVHG